MISVVITTKNRKNKCKEAIKSVLDQTYKDVELIVIDDASNDGTDKMVKTIKDKRLKYIKRPKSQGNQAFPKNEGTLASKGKYVAYLDSDNIYRPEHLQTLLNAIKGYDVVYGDRMVHYPDGTTQIGKYGEYDPSRLLVENYIDTSDFLITREALFSIGGWDEKYKRFLDWNLIVRLAKMGKRFKRVPVIITDYYIGEDSMSLTTVENKDNPNQPLWDPYDCEIVLPYLGEVKPPKVVIFTLTMNRLKYTKESFATLKKTAGYPYTHVIVDNGSTDGTKKWIEKNFDNYILNESNQGISIASNQALELISESLEADIIVKFDNDAYCLTDNWLLKMVDIWRSNRLL
jgi:glycosyltransferase involved in cell wall biosynthesis